MHYTLEFTKDHVIYIEYYTRLSALLVAIEELAAEKTPFSVVAKDYSVR